MNDQAAGIRRMASKKPVQVIAVSSGKGGVGKTNVSVNLSLAMVEAGQRVLLMDADLGLANVDLLLGLRSEYNLSHVISGERSLEEDRGYRARRLKNYPRSIGYANDVGIKPQPTCRSDSFF